MKKLSSNIVLGILIVVLSIITATANYSVYRVDGEGSAHTANARQKLADANTTSIQALQFVIYDYQLYDGWYINYEVNAEASNYYWSQFSDALLASVERDSYWDSTYYDDCMHHQINYTRKLKKNLPQLIWRTQKKQSYN